MPVELVSKQTTYEGLKSLCRNRLKVLDISLPSNTLMTPSQ
jgi:hypothetical protein